MNENEAFLTQQLITYIGNKRSLLDFIGSGVSAVQKRLNKTQLDIFDVFSGSGITARFFKRFARRLVVNDLERYAAVINRCYLANRGELDIPYLQKIHAALTAELEAELTAQMALPNTDTSKSGIISELYAPHNDDDIQSGERVFYTKRNALFLDTARRLIDNLPLSVQDFFLAPLLSEASIHANTAGVFKGFYKNSATGRGEFGGNDRNSLYRIKGEIQLPFPLFSNYHADVQIFTGDANQIVREAPDVDLAYLDPPYNQHPYGSNYFMLNLLVDYTRPESISCVAGIPADWNRSRYNTARFAADALRELIENIKAKFVLVSFNSEGFINVDDMKALLGKIGRLEVLETPYNTFRGSRNLRERSLHVTEYLYLLEK